MFDIEAFGNAARAKVVPTRGHHALLNGAITDGAAKLLVNGIQLIYGQETRRVTRWKGRAYGTLTGISSATSGSSSGSMHQVTHKINLNWQPSSRGLVLR